ncbi:MAG: transketolase [Gammaproteobacteria bacterium]|nr:transketolase [Gammaproteobacteria bacterium]
MSFKPVAMRDVFLHQILNAMHADPSIYFVSADFGSPILDGIREHFPNRFVNVGIAEQNLINITAGLALEGFKVFAYAIAPFITMRCYEQTRVNLALLSTIRDMNVTLIGVGAGYSYVVSGPTHQCYEDISIMRAMPNMGLFSPADSITAGALFNQCITQPGPKYLRLDAQVLPALYSEEDIQLSRGFQVLSTGKDICLIATGYMVHSALKVAEELKEQGIHATVIDLYNLSGFSTPKLLEALTPFSQIVSMEEGFVGRGGMDMMLMNWMNQHTPNKKLLNFGVQGSYRFELGSRNELHEQIGLGIQGMAEQIKSVFETV